jgi:hypothetical protein
MRVVHRAPAQQAGAFMTQAVQVLYKLSNYLMEPKLQGETMQAVTVKTLGHTHKQRHSVHVATTLYDVIEAVSDQVHSNEKYLLAPVVLKLLKDCEAGFVCKGSA